MKLCPKCGVDKPPEDFHRKSASADGLDRNCKSCRNAANRACAEKRPDHYRAASTARSRRNYKYKRDPQKRAHNAIQYALEGGRIVRPDSCESCGAKGRVSAHHEDYSKPLDVHWLCYRCHRRVHAGLITLAGVSGAD